MNSTKKCTLIQVYSYETPELGILRIYYGVIVMVNGVVNVLRELVLLEKDRFLQKTMMVFEFSGAEGKTLL